MKKILCFIPCYNCASQIERVIGQFANDVNPLIAQYITEILVIDNNSTDGTIDAAINAAQNITNLHIKIVRNNDNYNLGGTHKSAFKYARENAFDYVIILHGDDQGKIADILPILQSGEYENYDALLGARFMNGSKLSGYSKFRTFGNHIFNMIFTIVSGKPVYDLGSGLNIFATPIFYDEDIKLFADDLRFNVFLLLNIIQKRRKFKFFPISWSEDDQISNVRLYSQAIKTLSIAFEYFFNRKKFNNIDHRSKAHKDYNFTIINEVGNA